MTHSAQSLNMCTMCFLLCHVYVYVEIFMFMFMFITVYNMFMFMSCITVHYVETYYT